MGIIRELTIQNIAGYLEGLNTGGGLSKTPDDAIAVARLHLVQLFEIIRVTNNNLIVGKVDYFTLTFGNAAKTMLRVTFKPTNSEQEQEMQTFIPTMSDDLEFINDNNLEIVQDLSLKTWESPSTTGYESNLADEWIPSLFSIYYSILDGELPSEKEVVSNSLPGTPSNISIGSVTNSFVMVSLGIVPNVSMHIERKRIGLTYSEIAILSFSETYYLDTNILPATTYYYRVRAENNIGFSSYSNEINTTTIADEIATPSNLIATAISTSEINIIWVDNADNETGYTVEHRVGTTGGWIIVATLLANVTSYNDIGLEANTDYYYRVKAFDLVSTSSLSEVVVGTTMEVIGGGTVVRRTMTRDGSAVVDEVLPTVTTVNITKNALAAVEFLDTFTGSDGLITNEYAFWNYPAGTQSPIWEMDSGTLKRSSNRGWTGVPDSSSPGIASAVNTNSNVFRLNSIQNFADNIKVTLDITQNTDIHGSISWYGAHIWLRYINQYNLYYASIQRADGKIVIKRKVPCGSDNSGTYFELTSYTPGYDWTVSVMKNYSASIETNTDDSVTIKMYDNDISTTIPILTGTDYGGTNPNWTESDATPGKYPTSHYDPITLPGAIGVRGDYADFFIDTLKVSSF